MKVEMFFDEVTYTLTYIVYDETTKDAVIIDPVWNYARNASKLTTESVDANIEFIEKNGLKVHYILETHAHADHLSGSQLLKKKYPNTKIAIGETITAVQALFKQVFNMEYLACDGSQFDKLIKDGETFNVGSLKIEAFNTPGHTPACMCYLINGKSLFSGDALFMPDQGAGRCDFPKGSPEDLYDSIKNKIYTLDDDIEVYVGHDYFPGGRELGYKTTVGESKKSNVRITETTSKEEFVKNRKAVDRTLDAPNLIWASVQVNINAGCLPQADSNGKHYLKIPLN